MNREIGSTWGIWDLHVHTPDSHTTHYGGENEEAWKHFLEEIEKLPPSFKVIGVNDYLFLDGYKRLLKEKTAGRLANIELFLPVVEFRLKIFSGNDKLKKINFHIIFSNEIPADQIEALFLGNLKLKFEPTNGQSFSRSLSRANLQEFGKRILEDTPAEKRPANTTEFEYGFDNATFDKADIVKVLSDHQEFESKYLTAIGKAEWYDINWQQASADKKTLINDCDIVFAASPSPEKAVKSQEALVAQSVNNRLFHCSDSHFPSSSKENTNRMGHCYAWVKADPTFRGLKHSIEEYRQRVFLGELPPKLALLRDKPTKYIKTIGVKKRPNSSLRERWFDCSIDLNPDLVAIIGNKGSGKSALADIIGVLGNSPNEHHFSFLSDERFREPKLKKASQFEATLAWHDGTTMTRTLDAAYDSLAPETIKYVPQSYLEIACNTLGGSTETEFDKEIKAVIFSHISEKDRLEQDSLDALVRFQTKETNRRIDLLKQKLAYLNQELVRLEDSNSIDEVKRVQALLDRKKAEIEALDKSKPTATEPAQTTQSDELKQILSTITAKQADLNEKKSIIATSSVEIKTETLRLSKLETVLKKIDNFSVLVRDFQDELETDLADFGISRDEVFSYKLDSAPVDTHIRKASQKLTQLQKHSDAKDDQSEASAIKKIEGEIAELKFKLDEPNRDHQSQLKLLETWKMNRVALVGDENSPDTLGYYEAILVRKTELPKEIDKLRKSRIELTKQIFQEISKLSTVLTGYYSPVQDFIKMHQVSKDRFDFSFSVEHNIGHFEQEFLEFIDRGMSGAFSGKDASHKRVKDVLDTSDFNSELGVLAFLDTLVLDLVGVVGEASYSSVIRKQLRTAKTVQGLYDYLFSLDFLRPRYMLKADGKELSQLSPGQKGLLLLIFYLMIDKSEMPLVIDQPEENLDNQTVFNLLVPFIKAAKNRRQIIVVTHNPNLAVVCDAEQIIRSSLSAENEFDIKYESGAIENPEINAQIVDVLEGTYPAFEKRNVSYIRPQKD